MTDSADGADRRRWRTSPVPVVILALLGIITMVGGLAFDALRTARERDIAVASQSRSYEIIIAANELLAALENAETGQRGYLLTGDAQFRVPYDYGRRAVPELLGKLESLTTPHASHERPIGEIAKLIDDRFMRLQQGVDLVDNGDQAGAIALVKSGKGLETMNAIRARFASLKVIEAQSLQKRADAAASAAETASQSLYGVIAVGVAMLLVAALLTTAAIRSAIDQRVAMIAARGMVRAPRPAPPGSAGSTVIRAKAGTD